MWFTLDRAMTIKKPSLQSSIMMMINNSDKQFSISKNYQVMWLLQ